MPTATISYQGDLSTTCVHVQSGSAIVTDAPVDNAGKGEAFSPTDLMATSLVACMITTVAIVARRDGYEDRLGQMEGTVEKIMSTEGPRRIAALNVSLTVSNHSLDERLKTIVERIALTCPVQKSLHPDIRVEVALTFA